MHKHAARRDQPEFVRERFINQVRKLTPDKHGADERKRRESPVDEDGYDDRGDEHDDEMLNRTHTLSVAPYCNETGLLRRHRRLPDEISHAGKPIDDPQDDRNDG